MSNYDQILMNSVKLTAKLHERDMVSKELRSKQEELITLGGILNDIDKEISKLTESVTKIVGVK